MSDHILDEIKMDDDGFETAICKCGLELGPFPDTETMIDALMEHAAGVS